MNLKTPSVEEKSGVAGDMYEACDLRMAIEGVHGEVFLAPTHWRPLS